MPEAGPRQRGLAGRGVIQQDGTRFPATSSRQRVWPARPDDAAGRRGWLLRGRARLSSFRCCCQALSRESEFCRLVGTLRGSGVTASLVPSCVASGQARCRPQLTDGAAVRGDGSEMGAGSRKCGSGKCFPISRS